MAYPKQRILDAELASSVCAKARRIKKLRAEQDDAFDLYTTLIIQREELQGRPYTKTGWRRGDRELQPTHQERELRRTISDRIKLMNGLMGEIVEEAAELEAVS